MEKTFLAVTYSKGIIHVAALSRDEFFTYYRTKCGKGEKTFPEYGGFARSLVQFLELKEKAKDRTSSFERNRFVFKASGEVAVELVRNHGYELCERCRKYVRASLLEQLPSPLIKDTGVRVSNTSSVFAGRKGKIEYLGEKAIVRFEKPVLAVLGGKSKAKIELWEFPLGDLEPLTS